MSQHVRPAQLKDLGAIEALYRQQAREAERPPLKRQFASTRLWFLLNNTFASILPITSAADHVYVMEDSRHRVIQGFIQAENAALGAHVWQILNLCLSPDLDRFQDGTALLDHLFNEGLKRGVTKFIVRVAVGDPIADLSKARGFSAYATEHALLKEAVEPRHAPPVAGWRPMRREDELGVYLLYVATTPKSVAAVEASNFAEWRRSFQPGSFSARIPRRAGQPRFVVERVQVVGWMSLVTGGGGRPHSLGLMAAPQPSDLWASLDQLFQALPPHINRAVKRLDRQGLLLEVVLDLGREPEARFPDHEVILDETPVTSEDLEFVSSRVGSFGDDNRAGIERTLHRISVIRNRGGQIVGVTCRVGRAITGTIDIIKDMVIGGKSILLLGRPGIGKTTMLRECARVLADEMKKRVIIVDTSNEIGGDGDIPHPGIGRSRRMQVRTPALQHAVMIE